MKDDINTEIKIIGYVLILGFMYIFMVLLYTYTALGFILARRA